MKRSRNTREKRLRSYWYIVGLLRDHERAFDRNYPTRRAAMRAVKILRGDGWLVLLRRREEVQEYAADGRKTEQSYHVTAYSTRTRHKERFF